MAGYIGSKSSVTLVDGYSEAEADAEFVNDPNGAITVSGSNVGIGTSSPEGKLHVYSDNVGTPSADADDFIIEKTGDTGLSILSTSTGRIYFGDTASNDQGSIRYVHGDNSMRFETDSAERMRIDSSGNVLVGTTDALPVANNDSSGIALRADGNAQFSRSGAATARFNRGTSDGEIVSFSKDGTTVGSIGTDTTFGNFTISGENNSGLFFNNNAMLPIGTTGAIQDNTVDLGNASVRFDDIFATNGTIQTSDFNEKQDIASLTATEMLVGKRISALFKTFRWKDKVASNPNARTHTGVIAQDVQAAFTAEGLDAGDYALFISSTWWETQTEVPAVEAVAEVTDEDGNVTTEAVEAKDAYTRTDTYDTENEAPEGATSKTRMGIRYPELLSFVAAYNEQRFASIEARLTALEA